MPIYMDLHIVPGVNAKDVAEAHSRDVYLEKDHSCKCLTYWIDEVRGHVFCLIDAPNQEAVYELHNRSHGLLPHKIIEVQNIFVESFLGRITDPESGKYTDTGLLMLDDTSFRILIAVNTLDTHLMQHQMGVAAAAQLLEVQTALIKKEIQQQGGRQTLYEGPQMIGSFITAEKAVSCALAIEAQIKDLHDNPFSIRIHAGEPVEQTDEIFGDTILLLQGLRLLNRREPIVITSAVKALLSADLIHKNNDKLIALHVPDEEFLVALLDVLSKHYAENEFMADDYAQTLAMSKSQLYRKVTALTGCSPNDLLNNYRLEKSKELLQKKKYNITEVALRTGFTSPSYFSKCFKAKFELAPLTYQQLV